MNSGTKILDNLFTVTCILFATILLNLPLHQLNSNLQIVFPPLTFLRNFILQYYSLIIMFQYTLPSILCKTQLFVKKWAITIKLHI